MALFERIKRRGLVGGSVSLREGLELQKENQNPTPVPGQGLFLPVTVDPDIKLSATSLATDQMPPLLPAMIMD